MTHYIGVLKKKKEENSKYFTLFYSSTRVTDKGETLRFNILPICWNSAFSMMKCREIS